MITEMTLKTENWRIYMLISSFVATLKIQRNKILNCIIHEASKSRRRVLPRAAPRARPRLDALLVLQGRMMQCNNLLRSLARALCLAFCDLSAHCNAHNTWAFSSVMGTNDLAAQPLAKVQDVIAAFRPTRLIKGPPNTAYTSIDFDDSGEFLLLSRTDATIQLFNTKAGAHAKELKSQKYGSALARFTHHSTSIIYASTKVDDGIRYLSMHDNSFIRYFRGHTGRVTSLSVSPSDDKFLSASLDNTVKIWDCRSSNAQGSFNFDSAWLTAFDPSASVIAIASPPAQTVCLYDMRNYDKAPFATWDLLDTERRFQSYGQVPGVGWTGMEFSNNGKFLLVSTNGPGHYVLDAFTGDLIHYAHRPNGADPSHLAPGDDLPPSTGSDNVTSTFVQSPACFSPDGRYVIGGNGTQTGLLVWDAMEKTATEDRATQPVTDLPGPRHAKVVAYNPRHNLLASADKDVMIWVPDPDMI